MRTGRRAITAFAALGVIAGAGLMPGAAFAAGTGEAEVSGTDVFFTAGAHARNDVVLTRSGHTITITDRVAIRAGVGCVRVGGSAKKVRCTTSKNPAWVMVSLGDQNDRIRLDLGVETDISGGPGNDTLIGSSAYDELRGDSGNDVLDGRGGGDALTGGAGNDVLRGGKGNDYLYTDSGADTLLGGAGFDTVTYESRKKPVTVDLDGSKRDDGERGEKDTVGADVEGIIGGSGADRLTGNAAGNRIVGGPGNDGIIGGAGNDALIGQAGNDSISGGPGSDYLVGETPTDNNHIAKDHLDGGWDGPDGDTCIGAILATMVRCEHFS